MHSARMSYSAVQSFQENIQVDIFDKKSTISTACSLPSTGDSAAQSLHQVCVLTSRHCDTVCTTHYALCSTQTHKNDTKEKKFIR